MIWDEQARPGYGLYDRALGQSPTSTAYGRLSPSQTGRRCFN
jgi:D-mannonate dehydratase